MQLNEVTFAGYVGQDPKKFRTDKGLLIFNCSVGSSKKSLGGKDVTTWMNVKAFGDLAADLQETKKGDNLFVRGSISTGSYVDKEGNTRYTTDIVANMAIVLPRVQAQPDSSNLPPNYQSMLAPDKQTTSALEQSKQIDLEQVPF